MRLEQLQAFLAVAETGSFQKAAKLCNVTQSTISRQVQALEAEVGLPLLHRSAQMKLTVAGDRFFPHATKICREWKTALAELLELLEGKQSELCVAAIHSVCAQFLPPVLQKFCVDRPDVQLRVTSLGSDRALKVLRDGLVDVAIVMNNSRLTATSEMVTSVLFEESVKVLMAADHPLAKYEEVPWHELARYEHVVFKDGYGMQRLVREAFDRQNKTFKAALELNTLDAFRGIVRQGTWISLLPESALLEASQDPTLTVRPIAVSSSLPPLTRQVVVVTTQDRLEIPPIAQFYELVCNEVPPSAKLIKELPN
ncbi:MAG: LysR family transcriptional regulator [Cyanobacteria bacterium SID2]|nr:LysR family transcriptional regulator [Cyanobacteria bacterium SID2]MBP0005396.1 LysR family transcriptional regulator [Cyanobacteria bacterium SBC]